MSIDVSAEPAGMEQARDRWRAAVAAVLAKSSRREPADIDSETGGEPERLLDTPSTGRAASRSGRSTPPSMRCPSSRCLANGPTCGC